MSIIWYFYQHHPQRLLQFTRRFYTGLHVMFQSSNWYVKPIKGDSNFKTGDFEICFTFYKLKIQERSQEQSLTFNDYCLHYFFHKGNTKKFTLSFPFVLILTHKILKNTHVFLSAHAYYMSFCPQCTWDQTIGSQHKSILGTEAI